MAKRVTKDHAGKRAAPADDQAAEDLSVLYPDQELDLHGRKVTVREYGFIAGMRARNKGKPIIDDLTEIVGSDGIQDMLVEDYMDVLARHDLVTRELMLDSIDGADADWLESLDQGEGRLLLLTWWGVCGRFFFRVALQRLVQRTAKNAKAATVRDGQTSSGQPPATSTSTSGPSESGAQSGS